MNALKPPDPDAERGAWPEVHRHCRFSAGAVLLEASVAAAVAVAIHWIIEHDTHTTSPCRKLAQSAVAALGFGAVTLLMIGVNLFLMYPKPVTFPPSAATMRVKIGRLLMLFFGVGYVYRSVEILKTSKWIEFHGKQWRSSRTGVTTSLEALEVLDASPSDDDQVWMDGGRVAGLLSTVGVCGVLLSWYCGWHLRRLNDAMKRTRSLKAK